MKDTKGLCQGCEGHKELQKVERQGVKSTRGAKALCKAWVKRQGMKSTKGVKAGCKD